MSYLQNPDEFYRKFSNDSLYRDLIVAMYGFAFMCFLWAGWGLYGCLRSLDWETAQANYAQHPEHSSEWRVLCFKNGGEIIPVTRLYFAGNPPPLGIGIHPLPTPATIYFNPANPADNVAFRHPSWVTWLLVITGSGLLGLIPKLKSEIAV